MKKPMILGLALALTYFLIWVMLGLPYRLFPTDDCVYLPLLNGETSHLYWSDHFWNSWNPITRWFLSICRGLSIFFWEDQVSGFLLSSVLPNALILGLASIFTYRLTRSYHATLAFALIWGTAAWPATYHLMWYYAPFSAFLGLVTLLAMAWFFLNPLAWLPASIIAGLFGGLLLWSSPSSPLWLGLLAGFFILQLFLNRPLKAWRPAIIFVAFMGLAAVPVFGAPGQALIEHLSMNADTYHYKDAQVHLGYIPTAPHFTFLRICAEYNPFLLVAFILATILTLKQWAAKWQLPRTDRTMSVEQRIGQGLVLLAWAHSLAVDLLPFTKLARVHFIAFPILCFGSIIVLHGFLSARVGRWGKRGWILLGSACSIVVLWNLWGCREGIRARMTAPEALPKLTANHKLYLLTEDPHASFLRDWLFDSDFAFISQKDLERIANSGEKAAILIGPNGPRSGNSIMNHAILDDFLFETESMRNSARLFVLPYYVYYPPFLFEEEICQALYFESKTPDPRRPSSNLSLFLFGGNEASQP